MSTPAARVRFQASNGKLYDAPDPAAFRAWAAENGLDVKPVLDTPAAPRPAPEAAPAPAVQPKVGPLEAAGRGYLEQATLGLGVPAAAAGAGSMLQEAANMPSDEPIINRAPPKPRVMPGGPPIARAGLGAKLGDIMPRPSPRLDQAYDEGRAQYNQQTAAGEAQNPVASGVGRFAASLPQSAAVPQASVGPAAGMLKRLGTGALNVAGDAAVAGASGLATGGTEEAKNAAMVGGGASTALRGAVGVPSAMRGAAGLLARVRGSGMSPRNSQAVGDFLSDPKLRQAAIEGADVDATSRAMQSDLNTAETVRDAVLAESKVSLKPLKIAPKLEADGITNARTARIDSQQVVGDAGLLVDHMLAEGGRIKGLGRGANALQRVKKATQAYQQKLQGAPEGAEGVAHVYAALDQFKRELGAARNAAAKGGAGESDQGVADALEAQYHNLQAHLLDEAVWGPQTVALQDAVNKAWTKAIPALDEFGDRFSSRARTEKSAASAFGERPAVGSENVSSFISKAGTAANDDAERSLRNYMRESPELMRTLSEWYDVSGITKEGVKGAEEAIGRVGASLDDTIRTSTAARQLSDINAESPNAIAAGFMPPPASMINMIGKAERYAASNAMPARAFRGAQAAAGPTARAGGAAAAASFNDDAPYSVPSESVEQLAAENPEALGQWARQLSTAHSVGGKDKVRAIHSSLVQSDPQYRQMVQGLSEPEEEERHDY